MARAAEFFERSTRTQVQLVDDLLDVSRIVAGKFILDRKAVELPVVVRAALELVEVQAERKSLRFDVKVNASLRPLDGDPVRLQQVVWNLLTNAIKFTPRGGTITIAVDEVGESIRLRVSDTGSGIAPEFLPHVFNRFAQSDSSVTRVHGGLGLGLAIVRHVVELHGGTVRAESAGIGQGASFTVTLPLMPAEASRGSAGVEVSGLPLRPTLPVAARLDGLKILLVDDDPDARECFDEIFAGVGAEVVTASSAAEGRAALRRFTPDVILSDIAMPGEDGYSFLRSVRALGPGDGGDIPAIAVTAVATAADRELASAAGFQLHLQKPVDLDRLLHAVREVSRPEARDETLQRKIVVEAS
jgi:two-component system CheB/CheR fusion protein